MLILTDPASLTTQSAVANTVKVPYILIAGALLLLGLALAFMHLPHISTTQEFRPGKEGDPILSRSIMSFRHTVLGAIGIFFYVGVEVGLSIDRGELLLNSGDRQRKGRLVFHFARIIWGIDYFLVWAVDGYQDCSYLLFTGSARWSGVCLVHGC